MNRSRLSRLSAVLALALASVVGVANAEAQVFAVESPSYVRQIVEAAHQIVKQHPDLRFVVRTTEQVVDEDDEMLRRAIADSNVIVLGRVYGDVGQKLARAFAATNLRGKTIFAVYSDPEVIRLTRLNDRPVLEGASASTLKEISDSLGGDDPAAALAEWQRRQPELRAWTEAVAYVSAKGPVNFRNLFLYLLAMTDRGGGFRPAPVDPVPPYFVYANGQIVRDLSDIGLAKDPDRPVVAIVDYDSYFHSGDLKLLDALSETLTAAGFRPVPIIARWGESTYRALKEFLVDGRAGMQLAAIVSLQSFVLGGDQARDEVSALVREIGVPVFRGIRLPKRSPDVWKTSEDGLPWSSVYYQVAVPELQGVIEPILVGAERENVVDEVTGASISVFEPIPERISKMVRRIKNWHALQTKPSAEKRIAIVYYNHPPGKQNVGADYLNVPATILEVLKLFESSGYEVGDYPRDEQALLDVLLARGINVADWARGLQQTVARESFSVAGVDYSRWFRELPTVAQAEVRDGPLAYIRELVELARPLEDKSEILTTIDRFSNELVGFVETFDASRKDRAVELIEQFRERLKARATERLPSGSSLSDETPIRALASQIQALALEGVSGWGVEPGTVFVTEGGRDLVIPGVEYGNVFLGPQPQRGWQADVDALHSSTIVPPHHQYLAFYYYIHEVFRADAIIHVGRHSSYEWLPRKQVALADFDFPDIVIGDTPALYLYTVDGVGEGLQAKRRGLSVVVDHLIPPLKTTELYGSVLELQQLVEQYEAQDLAPRREAIARDLRKRIKEGHFASDVGDEVLSYDDDKLVHTVGHYLEELKTTFLPYGLHTFGKPWTPEKVEVLAESMWRMNPDGDGQKRQEFSVLIEASFDAERKSLIRALDGRYVEPGKGNDPIRTAEALPTGRNFFALDASVMPTRISYELARVLVTDATGLRDPLPDKIAAILWAVETVRDEGTMVSFVLQMLGVQPEWDVRGLVKDLRAVPLADLGRPRIDVVVSTSGLFRDLFGQLVVLLDKAFRVSLAASYHAIVRERPHLKSELDLVLSVLEEPERYRGNDPLTQNGIARHWVAQLEAAPALGGELAIARIFGPAEGAYGAGINRVIEQAWTWDHRTQISDVYIQRMSHAYTARAWGVSRPQLYQAALAGVSLSFHSRATNLYGVLDNDDYFDYFGGLSMAVERANGRVPGSYVLFNADPARSRIEPLERFLTREMRSRYFNPEWIDGMMREGYSGARTVSNKFVEFAWGWQVTNPDIIRDWMWNEVVDVYLRDKYDLGVTAWLSQRQNSGALQNIAAILLTAADKGFWRASPDTLTEIATHMGTLVAQFGPTCSAHSCGNLDTVQFAERLMSPDLRRRFAAVMAEALHARAPQTSGSAQGDRDQSAGGAQRVAGAQRAEAQSAGRSVDRTGRRAAFPLPLGLTSSLDPRSAAFVSLNLMRLHPPDYALLLLAFGMLVLPCSCVLSFVRQRWLRRSRSGPSHLSLARATQTHEGAHTDDRWRGR
jgi:cobaltochelatase CobN